MPKKQYIGGEAFGHLISALKTSGVIKHKQDLARLLGVSPNSISDMLTRGCDKRTSLAIDALLIGGNYEKRLGALRTAIDGAMDQIDEHRCQMAWVILQAALEADVGKTYGSLEEVITEVTPANTPLMEKIEARPPVNTANIPLRPGGPMR